MKAMNFKGQLTEVARLSRGQGGASLFSFLPSPESQNGIPGSIVDEATDSRGMTTDLGCIVGDRT